MGRVWFPQFCVQIVLVAEQMYSNSLYSKNAESLQEVILSDGGFLENNNDQKSEAPCHK